MPLQKNYWVQNITDEPQTITHPQLRKILKNRRLPNTLESSSESIPIYNMSVTVAPGDCVALDNAVFGGVCVRKPEIWKYLGEELPVIEPEEESPKKRKQSKPTE